MARKIAEGDDQRGNPAMTEGAASEWWGGVTTPKCSSVRNTTIAQAVP